MRLIATNERPFDVSHLADGRTIYGMYASLALKKIGVCEESGKVLVQPHWVGVSTIQVENNATGTEEAIKWTQQGAKPFAFDPLPASLDNLTLIRHGIPPMNFTAFAKLPSNMQPVWWDDWVKRSGATNGGTSGTGRVFAWDLGSELTPSFPQTSVVAQFQDGREAATFFEWHIIPQVTYDVLFKSRLASLSLGADKARQAAIASIESDMTEADWLWRLSWAAWIQGVAPCPELPKECLNLSRRIHLALPAGAEWVAKRFGSWLGYWLSAEKTVAEDTQLKLLTDAHEISRRQFVITSSRDLRLCPPTIVEEKPLRPSPELDEATLSRLKNIKSRLNELRNLDVNLSLQGAKTHKYHLNPPLDERTLQNIENRQNIILPKEYRSFLLHVGNGGTGPNYLATLQDAIEESRGILSEPFSTVYPSLPIPDEDECDVFAEIRWPDPNVNGALYIDLLGWGAGMMLIVTGEERGNLWHDLRGEEYFALPYPFSYSPDGGRLGFFDWYEKWLDDSINKLRSLPKN